MDIHMGKANIQLGKLTMRGIGKMERKLEKGKWYFLKFNRKDLFQMDNGLTKHLVKENINGEMEIFIKAPSKMGSQTAMAHTHGPVINLSLYADGKIINPMAMSLIITEIIIMLTRNSNFR